MIKEVHHRVKNNLQIILSLLNLDLRFHPDNPLDTVEATRTRINSMALIHEKIYGSKDLDHINLKDYIESEINELISMYCANNISKNFDLDDSIEVNIDESIPLGLIINEVFTNTIKYAFPNGECGNIFIELKKGDDENIILTIFDDGVGLPEDFNIDSTNSLGLVIIKNLINQLNGELVILNQKGTAYRFIFPC